MASIHESNLPGIGKQFSVETRAKDRLTIVLHDAGPVEIYYAPKQNPAETIPVATLDDNEARQLAAILARLFYRPEAVERLSRHGVEIFWHTLAGKSYAVGKSISELQDQKRNDGAIIAVIEKDGSKKTNPGNDYILKEGSQVALSGTQKEVQSLSELLEGGP